MPQDFFNDLVLCIMHKFSYSIYFFQDRKVSIYVDFF